MEMRDRTILVTGGARGIGLEIARLLHARGARLLLVGRDAEALAAAAGALDATVLLCDLADAAAVDRLIDLVRTEHPDLGGLVNNAAVQHELDLVHGDPFATIAKARAEIATNLAAPMALSIGLLPLLSAQPSAFVCDVNSGLALAPKEASPAYSASKAGLRALTAALRHQCVRHAPYVRVVDVILPMVDTDMTRGRGRGKMAAADAARAIVAGIERERSTVWIGKARLLPMLMRVAPGLVARLLRGSGHPAPGGRT